MPCKLPKLPTGYRNPYNRKFPNSGYVDPNEGGTARLAHPLEGLSGTTSNGNPIGDAYFPITGSPTLHDGMLGVRGTIVGSINRPMQIRINFGQRMTVGAETYIYAFSVLLDGHGARTFSGWMLESAIVPAWQSFIQGMPTVSAQTPPRSAKYKSYAITGGTARLVRSYRNRKLKVIPCAACNNPNLAASDYLRKDADANAPAGYVNITFALPRIAAISTNTLPVRPNTPVRFYYTDAVKPWAIPLYKCEEYKRVDGAKMTFVYGYVKDPGGARRFGWIAWAALRHPRYVRPPKL